MLLKIILNSTYYTIKKGMFRYSKKEESLFLHKNKILKRFSSIEPGKKIFISF